MSKVNFNIGDLVRGNNSNGYSITNSQSICEVKYLYESNDHMIVKVIKAPKDYESFVGQEYEVDKDLFELVKGKFEVEDEDTCNGDCEHCHKYDDDEEDFDDLNILQLVEVGDHVRGISDDYYVTSTEMTDGLVTYVDKEAKLIRVRVIAHRRNVSIGREFLVEQRDFEVIAPKISVGDYLVPTIRAEEAYHITGKDMILAKVTEIRKSTICIKVLAHKYKYHNGFEDFVDPRYFKKIATSSPIVQGVSGYVTDSEEGVEDILVLHIGDVTLALPSDLMGIFNVGIAVKSPDDEANQELGDILAISRMEDPVRIPDEKIKTEEGEA